MKGKVERPFDFIREGFWRGYPFTNLGAANRDLTVWLSEKSQRIHGTTNERVDIRPYGPYLLAGYPLGAPAPCDVSERIVRTVSKDCIVSVDGNRYVVPHTLVGEKVLARNNYARARIQLA